MDLNTYRFFLRHSLVKVSDICEGKENKEYFEKWGLAERLLLSTYSYDGTFNPLHCNQFLDAFFQSNICQTTLPSFGSRSSSTAPIGSVVKENGASVVISQVPTKVVSMEFFDKLLECSDIIHPTGTIRKCFDDTFQEILISDELRNMLLMDESDNYGLFNEQERCEFIFRIFQHLAMGGEVCQFEDTLNPYLTMTKWLYKTLLSVKKDPLSGTAVIASHVYSIALQNETGLVYPSTRSHIQNFAYAIIDPAKGWIRILSHRWD